MSEKQTGRVWLVGAGPGDPGLISLRAVECLRQADLVLYDGLVNPLLLRHTTARALRTCRASGPEGRRLQQDEINRRLIEAAREGKNVVRLKGGDPFIFGRGGEEAAALADAGIGFEVVPGITAAVAAAEYAGISLTHREHASAVAFITGHEAPDRPDSRLDYDQLARFPGTLVFYMGLHRLEQIAASLQAAGKAPDTPVAVISRATTPAQQTVTASLSEIADAVHAAELRAPSLIVVGDCVRQREKIAWFEKKPLFGLRIGITRPDAQADPVIAAVLALGAEPVLLPTIEILPPKDWSVVDAALTRLRDWDWIVFTSTNGVDSLMQRLWAKGGDVRRLADCRIAAIGSSTASRLEEYRLRADLVPEQFRAEALAAALGRDVAGRRVLWVRASRGRDVLPQELRSAGADVSELVVYQNIDRDALTKEECNLLRTSPPDWIGVSSPSIARNLARLLPDDVRAEIGASIQLASISPVTSAAARDAGLIVSAEAAAYTWQGILDAIADSRLRHDGVSS